MIRNGRKKPHAATHAAGDPGVRAQRILAHARVRATYPKAGVLGSQVRVGRISESNYSTVWIGANNANKHRGMVSVESVAAEIGAEGLEAIGGIEFLRELAYDEECEAEIEEHGLQYFVEVVNQDADLDELPRAIPAREISANGNHSGSNTAGPVQPVVLDPKDPLAIARRIIEDQFVCSGHRTLHSWCGDLRHWTGTYYAVMQEDEARAGLYAYLEHACRVRQDVLEPFKPTAAAVSNVLDAMKAAAHLRNNVPSPCWLDNRSGPAPDELITCANGVLHLPTRQLISHSPQLFSTHALPFGYAPNVGEPSGWLQFLESVWPGDAEAIGTLQEIFGYVLSGNTRQQKIFLLVGPKRSGKGTVGRVLRSLVGPANVAGPTLSSLATNFGLQSLIDRPLAIVSDARLSGRTDQAVIVERLLSVSGEDVLTIDRKHREPWIGQLGARFLILTNELPRLSDTSGALASRFLILTMTRSWYGHEDVELFDRLGPEMPAILSWALDGYDRLKARGYFMPPASSDDAIQEMANLGSPVGAFLEECCIVEPGAETATELLYSRWKRWCEEHGQTHVSTEQIFGRDLRAVIPGLKTGDRRREGNRLRVYLGVRLKGP